MSKYLIAVFIVAVLCIYGVFSQGPVNQQCLGCICEAMSGCNTTSACHGNVCGPFKMTWAYWADSGKPTLNGESQESESAYANCSHDIYCAALSVQGYMEKFQTDCNGDGKIDCDDYVHVHILGGYGCNGALPQAFNDRYQQCKKIVGSG